MIEQLTGKRERGNKKEKQEQKGNKCSDRPKSECANDYIKW